VEQLTNRYWWAVRLVFITMVAWLGARTINVFVGAKVEPPLTLDLKPQARNGPAPTQVAPMIDINRLGKLFGIDPPPPPPPEAVAAENTAATAAAGDSRICWDCDPVKTGLRLQLLFSLVATTPRYSIAHIRDLDQNRVSPYSEGDRLCQWVEDDKRGPERCEPKKQVVLQILEADVELGEDGKWVEKRPRRVVILNEETSRLEFIDGTPGNGAVAVNTTGLPNLGTAEVPPATSDAPPANNAFVQPGEIVMRGENEGTVKKDAVGRWMGDLNAIATQARIVPSFKNGVANGFKLFSIRPDSLYSALGVQNGDVISRINGFDMNSPDKALEIWGRLKDTSNIEITVERRGQLVTKKFQVE